MKISLKFFSKGPINNEYSNIGSDNTLDLPRWQAIILMNDG